MTLAPLTFDNLSYIAEYAGAPQITGGVNRELRSLRTVVFKSLFVRYGQDDYLQPYAQLAITSYPDIDQAQERVRFVYELLMKNIEMCEKSGELYLYIQATRKDVLNPSRLSYLAQFVESACLCCLFEQTFYDHRTLMGMRSSIIVAETEALEDGARIRKWMGLNSEILNRVRVIKNPGGCPVTWIYLFVKTTEDARTLIPMIPREIRYFSNLTDLYSENCALKIISKEIANLRRLQSLWLGKNELFDLPCGMENLSNLQMLNLGYNKFTSFPSAICKLRALKYLHLDNNQIPSIPKEIENLKDLRMLDLSMNKISSVPEELAQLPQLEHVSLTGNPIRSVPLKLLLTKNASLHKAVWTSIMSHVIYSAIMFCWRGARNLIQRVWNFWRPENL